MNFLNNKLIIVAVSCPNKNREVFVYKVSLNCYIWRIYFHQAKFDNYKDEKMAGYKIVSVTQNNKIEGTPILKLALVNRLKFVEKIC